MDRVAHELELDRAEVRRRNFIKPEQMPYKVGIIFRDGRPVTYDSGDYPTCQRKALEAADYDGFAARQAQARAAGRYIGHRHRQCGRGDRARARIESATVRVSTSGKLDGLYRRDAAGPVAQDHARPDRRRPSRRHARRHRRRDRRHRRDRASGSAPLRRAPPSMPAPRFISPRSELAHKIKQFAAEMMEAAERGHRAAQTAMPGSRGVPASSSSFREIAVRAIGMPGFSMAGGPPPGLEATAISRPTNRPIPTAPMSPRSRSISRPAT